MTKLIVALDFERVLKAINFLPVLGDRVSMYKVGSLFLNDASHYLIRVLKNFGKTVFVDLKLFDIPSTVERELRELAFYEVDMATVHTLAGPETLKAAAEVEGIVPVGVTLLTSMEVKDLLGADVDLGSRTDLVLRLVEKGLKCGINHFVASIYEVEEIKKRFPEVKVVVPGIRIENDSKDDQKFTASPEVAVAKGADYIVVGRSITRAKNPAEVVESILKLLE